jgi:outer membrane protein TolC
MTMIRDTLAAIILAGFVAAQPARASAQNPAAAALSLEAALNRAVPASENLEIAKAAVLRARGEQYRAKADYYPQLHASASFNRLLRSQFEGFSFGGSDSSSGSGGDQLPFGKKNTYNLGLSLSQSIFTGGRIVGQGRAADAGRRSAELGITSAQAQLTLDVVQAYYDAVTSDLQLQIAQVALDQADTTLKQAQQRKAVGTQPEFEVLRARVARDNQRTAVIVRRSEREVALIRLKQFLNLPIDEPIRLTTSLADTTMQNTPTLALILAAPSDTSAPQRYAVRQAEEALHAQEALSKVSRSQQFPQLVLTSVYGNVGYPGNYDPFAASYFTNWNITLGLQIPVYTGGRIKGDKTVADANVREAQLRMRQLTRLARVDTRTALSGLEAAGAAWSASEGTVEQAQRAYQIADLRYKEGLSTQTELLDARLALQTAESLRIEAARALQVARVRVALIEVLPLAPSSGTSTQQIQPTQQRSQTNVSSNALPGTTP